MEMKEDLKKENFVDKIILKDKQQNNKYNWKEM